MTTRLGDYLDRRWWMRLLSLFPFLIRIEFCNSSSSCLGCCTKVAMPILMNDVDLKPSYVPIVTVEMSLHILNINVFIKTNVNPVHNAPRRSLQLVLRISHSGSLSPIKTPRISPHPLLPLHEKNKNHDPPKLLAQKKRT